MENDNNSGGSAAVAAAPPVPPNDEVAELKRQIATITEQMSVLVTHQLSSTSGGGSYVADRPFNPAAPDAHLIDQQREQRGAFLRKIFGRGADGKQANDLARRDIASYRRLKQEAMDLKVYGR